MNYVCMYILGETSFHGIEIFTEEIIKKYIHKIMILHMLCNKTTFSKEKSRFPSFLFPSFPFVTGAHGKLGTLGKLGKL